MTLPNNIQRSPRTHLMRGLHSLFIFIVIIANAQLQAADIVDSADHPLVGRFLGSDILGYQQSKFDEYLFDEGGVVKSTNASGYTDYNYAKSRLIEGKITRIYYVAPAESSVAEVNRNYLKKLADNGFDVVYQCRGDAYSCGGLAVSMPNFKPQLVENAYLMTENRYTTLRKSSGEGDVYISLLVFNYSFDSYSYRDRHNRPTVQLDVIEVEALDDNQIEVVSADKIVSEVNDQGRIALYGIYFDSGKSVLEDKSIESIEQIAKALTDSPELNLHVVGHTDNVGRFENNMALAKDRAISVVNALTSRGIKAGRLTANGVASLAPVASNNSEQGRAKNRRVELVAR